MAASLLLPPFDAIAQTTAAAEQPVRSPSRLSLLDVPYLSQSEALCGGAAAAMVLRYWGARGVAAEDFAPLVDRTKAGIEASKLVQAVRERGFEALPASGTGAMVQRELSHGRPVVALVEDRPGAFHYVVIVGWHERAVVLHDPARTPYMLMDPAEFERRWKPSRNWLLVVLPTSAASTRSSESTAIGVSDGSPASVVPSSAPGQRGCDAMVADGVHLAQQNDLGGAERVLTAAAYACGGAAFRELAGVRLLQRRWPEVRDLAARAVESDPADAHAWRLLASARYITGDRSGALDAWNRAGEPTVNLVSVNGLQRTTHRAVERVLRVSAGSMLTRGDAERARRRLDELPAAALSRLEYVPRGSGLVEVRAHVLERSVLPAGRLTWAAIGLRAVGSREIQIPLSSLGRGGERLDLNWRFWPTRPGAGAALRVPGRVGLWSLSTAFERQPFNVESVPDARRTSARVALADWATSDLRWEVRAGLDRWRGARSFGALGGTLRAERGRLRTRGEADLWFGEHAFASGGIRSEWQSSTTRRGTVVTISAAGQGITSDAPLDLWPGGDTGHLRQSLLRAHPLLDGGRLRVDRVGRMIVHTTAEVQHWWRAAAVPIGGAAFLDAARTLRRTGTLGAIGDVDVGAGFRLALPGHHGNFRADLARGLRDGRTVFSIGWAPDL